MFICKEEVVVMKKVICGFSQGSVLTLSLSNFQEWGY